MSGLLDYLASLIGLMVEIKIDVRITGAASGFNYTTSMYPTNDQLSIETFVNEVVQTAIDLDYKDQLDPALLFVYVERKKVGDIIRLERIEDVTIPLKNHDQIRVQMWSDFLCDSGKEGGDLSTIDRLQKK